MPRLRAGGVGAASPNGVLGDPAGASADDGRKLLEQVAGKVAAALGAVGASV